MPEINKHQFCEKCGKMFELGEIRGFNYFLKVVRFLKLIKRANYTSI